MKDTVIIIPAYNEEKSIALVLNDIPRDRILEIIVVDNNSTDQTATIAKDHGAHVVFEKRQGYGQACLTGMAVAQEFNPTYIIFIDGDYSDYPQEMSLHFEQLDRGFDFVVGSRTLGKAQKGALLAQAIFGNWLATTLMSLLFKGESFSDLGPFRAIRWDKLQLINMQDTNFGWTVEMQVKALIYGLKCSEVSVSYRPRIGVSKITGTVKGTILAGYKILYTIFYYYLRTFKLRSKLNTKKYDH